MKAPQKVEHFIYQSYGASMAFILAIGTIGNGLATCVLLRPEHRKRPMTFLMLNMCFADLLVCAFGYTVAIYYNMTDSESSLECFWRCTWLAFVNCATGISVIGTLTAMSFVSYKGVTTLELSHQEQIPRIKVIILLGTIWMYAIFIAIPPMFGWNEFVPLSSKVSCHPNWESPHASDVAYIATLAFGGFFVPLTSIIFFYVKMFRYMKKCGVEILMSSDHQKKARLLFQKKTARLIIAAIVAFLFSWSPYCFISLASTIKSSAVVSPLVSLAPEMMAKASVIYNPIIYLFLNSRFRLSLKNLFCGTKISPNGTVNTSSQRQTDGSSRSNVNNKSIFIATKSQRGTFISGAPKMELSTRHSAFVIDPHQSA